MSRLSTEVIRGAEFLAALEQDWWDLWRRCQATPFQSPGWLLPWWHTFHPGVLLTVAVRDPSRLVALAPLYIECGPAGRRLLPIGIALSDYLDILIDSQLAEAGAALVRAIEAVGGWDTWSLEELPPGASALSVPCPPQWQEASEPQSVCPILHLPDSVDRLKDSVPAVKLRKLRTARNRASRRGGFVLERVEPAGAAAFLGELFRLHGTRWTGRGEPGVLEDERVRRFHEAAAPPLLAAGLARCFLLRLESCVVAAYYGFCDRGKAFGYLTGFDPQFAFESPGAALVGYAIESAVSEGCTEFHFLRGRESYKYGWGAVDTWSVRRSLTRNTARVSA